jgi:sulfatase maturation enzyme AslB (radical SAM superfamily)
MSTPSNRSWSVPAWITSRSYFTGTDKARTIITNSKWSMYLVLEEISSDLWSVLPRHFQIESLQEPLHDIGIDLNDPDHRQEVESFLHTLWQDGVLVNDSEVSPEPTPLKTESLEDSRQFSSVAAVFNEGLANEGILSSVFIELTYRCNESCIHCFNPRSTYDPSTDLSTEEILKTLAELEEMGTYNITLSGGEVSLRDDFFDIMCEARHRDFAVSVFTNGQVSPETDGKGIFRK